MASGSYLLLLVVLWYCFSYVFNVATKGYWMATEELGGGTVFPLMASVFVTNAVAGSLWVMHLTSSLGRPAHAAMGFSRIAHVVRSSMWQDFCLLCISGAVGITASIVVLQHGSIQLVQVTRSLGPLFTAAWAYLMLDQTTSTPALGCLLLALAGTVLASWQEPTFCALTAALMLTVNTTLTFRNAATKRILRGFPEAAAALSSGAGLDAGAGGGAAEKGAPGGKLPGSGGSGGSVGSDKGSGGAAPGAAPSRAPPAGAAHSGAGAAAFHSPEALACALLVLTNVAGLVCTLALWGCAAWRGHHAAAAGAARVLLPPDAWRLLLVVGGSNFMYNVASQLCLAHVAVVSHGMLELFKRVFVLLAASALLGDNDWAWHNAAGAGAATLGTILYFCTVRRSGHGNTGRDGPELGALPSLSGPEAVGGGTKNGAHAATVHVALAPTELQLEGSWKAPGEQLKQRGRAAREACAPWAPAAARGGGGHLGAAGAGAGGALGGGWAGDGGGGGSILGGVGGGGGTPSHKLQLAYGLIVAVLLCSPVELAAGAGVTSWTPAWLRPGAEWSRGGAAGGGDSSDGGGLQLGASGGAQHAGGGGGTPVGTSGGGARGGGGALSLAPLDSAAVLARVDAAYVPGPPPLRGGPRMPGVLPYHLSLKRLPDAAGSVPPHCRTLPGRGNETATTSQRAVQPARARARRSLAAEGAGATGASGASDARRPSLVGVYSGWLGHRNLGDEIVADLFLDLLAGAIVEATPNGTCVSIERASKRLLEEGWGGCTVQDTSGCDFGVLGGGSTVYVDYVKRMKPVVESGRPVFIFGSGFQTGLLQKSTNERYLKMLCRGNLVGGVRGPYTQAHLAKFGCSPEGAGGRVIGDSAVLAGPVYSGGASSIRAQLRTHVSAGRHVVVATLKDHALFAAFNASACTLLGTGRAAIVMQAVDEESAQLHAEFAAIVDASRPEGSPPVLVHAEYKDWAAILDVYRHASAALSSRLHSGVLALAANVPAVYVAANTKYKDLMSSLGLRNLVVDPNFRRHADAGAAKFGAFLAGEVTAAVNASAEIGARLAASHSETLATYKVEVGEFLARLREADAPRFAALMCCTHGVAITRSLPREHKALVQLACVESPGGGSAAAALADAACVAWHYEA